MATMTRETEPYIARFADLEQARAGKEPAPLRSLRRDAMGRFAEMGFPTPKLEDWKYTNTAPIARTAFRPSSRGSSGLRPSDLPLAEVARCRLVFVNGLFAPELSALAALPAGLHVSRLSEAWEREPGRIEAHLAHYARFDRQPFVALNTALMEDGAFVRVARGAVVEEPIHLLFFGSVDGEPAAWHPRTLIVGEENSQATVIETYVGREGSVYLTNAVTEVVLAENAVLEHYRVQEESDRAFHVATLQVQQDRNSNFASQAITFGGALVRNDVNAVLDGEGIESTLNGLYVASGRQHVDTHTAIDHAKPHCNSHELYKGILDGHARGVFSGKIFVRQDAQKTDAKQTNQNLLLSRDAEIDTKPQLEIFADDVRCTHGATIGQLDEDAVFYLRARGIGLEEARGLLTYAFASDILGRIKVEPLRSELEKRLFARLPRTRLVDDVREAVAGEALSIER